MTVLTAIWTGLHLAIAAAWIFPATLLHLLATSTTADMTASGVVIGVCLAYMVWALSRPRRPVMTASDPPGKIGEKSP